MTKPDDKQLFMRVIQEISLSDITILDIPVLQAVINFKWDAYTKAHFVLYLVKTVIFMTCFIIDIIALSPDGFQDEPSQVLHTSIVTRSICGIYMLDFIRSEIQQWWKAGIEKYFSKDIWNIFDLALFLTYMAYIPVSFVYSGDAYSVKALQCAIIQLFVIKLNFYLRIFDTFAFLVQMI